MDVTYDYDQAADPQYKIGDQKTFVYPTAYSDDPSGYHEHSGQTVTVVRPLSYHDEYENLGDPMYLVRADDGWEGQAWESELSRPAPSAGGTDDL